MRLVLEEVSSRKSGSCPDGSGVNRAVWRGNAVIRPHRGWTGFSPALPSATRRPSARMVGWTKGPWLCAPASRRVCPFEDERCGAWQRAGARPRPDHQNWPGRLLIQRSTPHPNTQIPRVFPRRQSIRAAPERFVILFRTAGIACKCTRSTELISVTALAILSLLGDRGKGT